MANGDVVSIFGQSGTETCEVDADGIIRDFVTWQTPDGEYEAHVDGEQDPEGYRRGFGKTPEEAIENWHEMWDDLPLQEFGLLSAAVIAALD